MAVTGRAHLLEQKKQEAVDQKNEELGRQYGSTPLERNIVTGEATGRAYLLSRFKDDKARAHWEDLPAGQRFSLVAREIPSTLYHLVPEATRELSRKGRAGEDVSFKELVGGTAKGVGQFAQTIGVAVSEGIFGGVLSATEKVTGYEDLSVDIPILGEIKSWGGQIKGLTDAGFTEAEARMLVGTNAYLSAAPTFKPILKSRPAVALGDKALRQEVPVKNTIEGLRRELDGEVLSPDEKVIVDRSGTKTVKEVFGNDPNVQKFDDLKNEFTDEFFTRREELLSKEDPVNAKLLKLSEPELKTYTDYVQGFVSLVDEPSVAFKEAVAVWKKTNKEIEAFLIDRGQLTKAQVEARRWKPIESITGKSKAELEAQGVEPIYYPYLAEDALSKSDFVPSTGRRTKGGYLKRFTGKLLYDENYIKNPQIAIPRHRMQIFRDTVNGEFVNGIIENFAEKNPKVIKAFKENPRLAKQYGYEEWKPAGSLKFYPVKTAKGKSVPAVSRKVETHYIPASVNRQIQKLYHPGAVEKALRMTYDPAIDLWKVSVLHMTGRWIYNNFMGNLMLSSLGGAGPVSLAKGLGVALANTKPGGRLLGAFGKKAKPQPKGLLSEEFAGGEGTQTVGKLGSVPSELTQSRTPIENWLNMLETAKQVPALRIPAKTTQGIIKGYIALGKPGAKLNTVIENWFRSAIYISKTEGTFLTRNLKKPVPEAEGVAYVNEFLNDYSKNLTRVERRTIRRALPFWNWQKFITKFAFKFPTNHPTRALLLQALMQEYVDYIAEDNQVEDKQKSILRIKTDVDLDGRPLYINVKSAIPFSDVFRTIPTNFETAARFLTSNPFSKILIERGFRINSFTGQPFSSPDEKITFDNYGNPINPVPSLDEHITQQFSQKRILTAAVDRIKYGEVLRRYDTGEPKMYNGKIQTSDMMLETFKYFGLSLSPLEVNKMTKRIDKQNDKKEKDLTRYERQLKRRLDDLREAQLKDLDARTDDKLNLLNEPTSLLDDVKNAEIAADKTILSRFLQELYPKSVAIAPEIPQIAVESAKSLIHWLPRLAETLALDATGKEVFVPSTPLEKMLFGKEPVRNIKGTGGDLLAAAGSTPAEIEKFALGTGLMLTALDLTGPKKPKFNLSKSPITTKSLSRLKETKVNQMESGGEIFMNKLEIMNEVARKDIRAPEANVMINSMNKFEGNKVPFSEYIDEVEGSLLVLRREDAGTIWSGRHLPKSVQGSSFNYADYVYESPVKVNAGSKHFSGKDFENYFGHVRTDKVSEKGLVITRDLELQSDLFQKGRLKEDLAIEKNAVEVMLTKQAKFRDSGVPEHEATTKMFKSAIEEKQSVIDEFNKLLPYSNTWHSRMLSSRIQEVANEGGGKYRLPTGETAMRIEGLSKNADHWVSKADEDAPVLTPTDLKQGREIGQFNADGEVDGWMITDVLGDGKFKAIRQSSLDKALPEFQKDISVFRKTGSFPEFSRTKSFVFQQAEEFNITPGEANTGHTVYKFYEKDMQKELKRTGMEVNRITDPQGIDWFEVDIPKEKAGVPVEAFGITPMLWAGDFISDVQDFFDDESDNERKL